MADDDVPPSLSKYIDRDAWLFGKVDFLGLIADLGKGTLLAVLSIFTGIVIGIREAASNVYASAVGGMTDLLQAPGESILGAQEAAVASAEQQIITVVPGYLALPVSTVVALSASIAIALAVYLIFGRLYG